jgi:glycerol uptake facilitator-like aquaporin
VIAFFWSLLLLFLFFYYYYFYDRCFNLLFSFVIFQIAFTFGLMIAVCIQMFGHVSGGHMNPAVSLAMAVATKISPSRAIVYIKAQCAGGILGSLLLKW